VKKLLSTTALLSFIAMGPAAADPGVMVGISYDFGHTLGFPGLGLTAKLTSSDRAHHFIAGGGVSFFPFAADKFGIDGSVGYNFDQGALMAGVDVLNLAPQVSGGWADTHRRRRVVVISDRRLKRDIRLLLTLPNRMNLYAFRYLWSDTIYVGVMAQDLLRSAAWEIAVIRQADGHYAVDYAALGLRMATLAEFRRQGIAAIVAADAQLAA
jgi:endosialidase-like protein